jgi:hypothetical protein
MDDGFRILPAFVLGPPPPWLWLVWERKRMKWLEWFDLQHGATRLTWCIIEIYFFLTGKIPYFYLFLNENTYSRHANPHVLLRFDWNYTHRFFYNYTHRLYTPSIFCEEKGGKHENLANLLPHFSLSWVFHYSGKLINYLIRFQPASVIAKKN